MTALGLVASSAIVGASAGIAAAAPSTADSSTNTTRQAVSPDQALVHKIQAAQARAVRQGSPVKVETVNGYDIYALGTTVRVVPSGSDPNNPVQPDSFCTWAVYSASLAVGAAILAGLAATGGAEIAGIFLGPATLNALAAAVAAGSGLYAFIAANIC